MFTIQIQMKENLSLEKIQRMMPDLARYLAERLTKGARDAIDQSQNPYGDPFRPLTVQTIAQRRRRGIGGSKPLLATGLLKASIRWDRTADGAEVHVDQRAIYHQFGTRYIPKRQIFPSEGNDLSLPPAWQDDVGNFLQDYFK